MDNRTPLIAGNWKMYKTIPKLLKPPAGLSSWWRIRTDVDIMIAPVFTALDPVSKVVKDSRVGLGAQNLVLGKGRRLYRGNICGTCWCRPDANT